MKSEKYLPMLNNGKEYIEIVNIGVSPIEKMGFFETGIKR